MPDHWLVIGGGVLGLGLARKLVAAGRRVTVLEAAPEVGGLAAAHTVDGVTWDRFYHVILQSDSHVHDLLADLGLADRFVGKQTRTGFYTDGTLHSLSNSLEFLWFPPLGLLSKFRLGLTILHASRVTDWKALEKIPVVEWLAKWSGRHTTEKIWLPLLRAKLGDSYRIASAAFIWAIIARMYAARRSGLKTESFGYVRGGYATVLRRFADVLTERGVTIRTGAAARSVEGYGNGVRVTLANGEVVTGDRAVLTAAAPLVPALVPQLTAAEKQRFADVTYQGIVCASVLLTKPLASYYVTNITDADVPFTAVIEMTALVEPGELGGRHLVYLPKYVAPDDPLFDESDESIRRRFLAVIARMYPHFAESDVLGFAVSRVRNVFAVSTLNYSATVPPMTTSVPGVSVVNSAHIVNGTLNVNETLALAASAAPGLLRAGVPAAV